MAAGPNYNWQTGKTLCQSASFMLENEIATDVTFTFQNSDIIIKAHRFVLIAKSPVFFAMFTSKLDKPGEDIEISDVEPATFKELLKYLYTDETTLSALKALQLTYCAEKYEVTDLKAKCTKFLQLEVDETTVAVILDHAVLYNDDILISTCQDVVKSLETLSCLEEHHLSKDTLELILGFEGLAVGEVDIFKFCNTWGGNECKRMEVPVNASNKRKMLGPLLRRIPFCSMTHEEFASEVSGKHLLNGQEELQIFRFICAPDESKPPFPCKPKKETKKPFPCKPKKETKKPFISVKLPDMQGHHRGHRRIIQNTSQFRLEVSCSTPYTLLGLGFTQAGNYNIYVGGSLNSFQIQAGNLQGLLETPLQYQVGRWVMIIQDASYQLRDQGIHQTFTHVEHVEGQACPIQLVFNLRYTGHPPFDTLLVQI